ncbi:MULTISPECIES: YfgM family protein [unclassified Luteimonas]
MAIDDVYDDHEQGERVRDWLRRNSLGLAGGIAIGLALIGGWQWWNKHQHGQRVAEGERYQAVVDAIAAGDLEQAGAHADTLDSDSYTILAALSLAKAQFETGDAEAAIATLRGAGSSDPALEPIRQHRLAQLLIETGQAAEAVDLLVDSQDPASLETLGDAQVILDRREDARESYQAALRNLDVAAPQRGLVELKLIDAGGKPAQAGAI